MSWLSVFYFSITMFFLCLILIFYTTSFFFKTYHKYSDLNKFFFLI